MTQNTQYKKVNIIHTTDKAFLVEEIDTKAQAWIEKKWLRQDNTIAETVFFPAHQKFKATQDLNSKFFSLENYITEIKDRSEKLRLAVLNKTTGEYFSIYTFLPLSEKTEYGYPAWLLDLKKVEIIRKIKEHADSPNDQFSTDLPANPEFFRQLYILNLEEVENISKGTI